MPSDHDLVRIDEAVLRTRRTGDPDGRPLLFLHGGLNGTMRDFDPLLPALAGFRCILMDSRGHGGSTLGTALSYERLALDAEAVIDFHKLTKPVVIGHSDGGIAAIRMAARRKDLAGIILLGADVDPPPAGAFAGLTPEGWRAKFPDEVALYERLNPEPDFHRLFRAVLAMWRSAAPDNYPGRLAERVACPALVLGGDKDRLVPSKVTFQVAQRIPGAHLGILPFGSHVVAQEHPERVLPYLMEFLSTLV